MAGVPVFRLGAAILAVLLLLCALPLVVIALAPGSGAAQVLAQVFPSARVHAAAADAAFTRKDWSIAEAQSRAELAVSPVDDDAWLRLARIDVARTGGMTEAGFTALAHSYDAVPYDTSAKGARRCFARAWSASAPPGLRESIEAERRALASEALPAC